MNFLPIVARELRVAARRRSTFIIRSCVALAGIAICGTLLFFFDLVGQTGAAGGWVFGISAGYTFLIAVLAGIFLSSDCVSEERREGTLGFLFLTDLKGYDVVLGKFAGVSLNAFYGILAIFPVLALCFLGGGVTGGEFWRMCLSLCNALFFSVAASIWVSAQCKSASRAMAGAVCLLAGVLAVGGLAMKISKFGGLFFYLGAISPLSSYSYASANYSFNGSSEYWRCLATCHAAGWLFLGLASLRLRFFREREAGTRGWIRSIVALTGPAARRSELLDINPVVWLLNDSRRLRWVAWAITIAGGATVLLAAAASGGFGSGYVGWPFYFVLKIFFAIQACRFFSESRRNGALELLSSTPMKTDSILSGQWMALRQIFLWPIIILLLSQLACLCFLGDALASMRGSTTSVVVITNGVSASSGPGGAAPYPAIMGWFPVILTLKPIANSIADFFALGWFGMWLALSLQKPAMATGLTILYVLVLPTIAFCIPTLATDTIFIIVGYSKLQQDFRIRSGTVNYKAAG